MKRRLILFCLLLVATAEFSYAEWKHPFLLFSKSDIPALKLRAQADHLLQESLDEMRKQADAPVDSNDVEAWTAQLEARAFIAVLDDDPRLKKQAIECFLEQLRAHDPHQFYAFAEFHLQAMPLRALALAWDCLQPDMDASERVIALAALTRWCATAFEHTNDQWWREASYNVGAIPVSGVGFLALAIREDVHDPAVEACYREASRRIAQNYFPTAWKPSGICYEGPNYAIVGLKYSALFAHAMRRAGGDDILSNSGAAHASRYLMYQYMPWGGCAPIGDNTDYGSRTFAAEYLLEIGATHDAEGFWTWRQYARARRLDPLMTYLWYPVDLAPVSPLTSSLPTSAYFEVTPNRAGYTFCRSAWEDRNAAFFAFVTRFERCNHQHYDMQSFLFGGFGTLFATHRMLYPYPSDFHGIDWEHNLVIVNGGGWPHANRTSSCGDDNSTEGILVGRVLGRFADYLRSDAKWSYRDNAVLISDPAIRAERACLFVKTGGAPYLVVIDDNQQLTTSVRYEWLWHAPQLPFRGAGTWVDPFVLTVTNTGASCAIHFVQPAQPDLRTESPDLIEDNNHATPSHLVRLRVAQTGARVHYAAVATLQRCDAERPRVTPMLVLCANPSAGGVQIEQADGTRDIIVWQSEEARVQCGEPLSAGELATDGLLAMVRIQHGTLAGFVLGEGTMLRWNNMECVHAESSCSAVSGCGETNCEGRLRTREGLPDVQPIHAHLAAIAP